MRRIVLVALLLTACTAPTGDDPRVRVIPVESDSVVVRPVGSTPSEPVEGVIRCALAYDGVAICWQVTDSVSGVTP